MNKEKICLSVMFVMAMVISIGTLIFACPVNPEIYSMGLIGGMCSIIGIYLLIEILSGREK